MEVGKEMGFTPCEKSSYIPGTFTSYCDKRWQVLLDQRRKPVGARIDIFTLRRRQRRDGNTSVFQLCNDGWKCWSRIMNDSRSM